MSTKIQCPSCRHAFELDEAVRAQVSAEARRHADAELQKAVADADLRAAKALYEKEEELTSVRAKAEEAARREAELLQRARILEEKTRTQELDVARKIAEETGRIRAEAVKEAEERAALETAATLRLKEEELAAARTKAALAAQREAELLRRERELEEKAQSTQLEIERKLAEESARIHANARKEADARASLELADKLRQKDEEVAEARSKAAQAAQKEAELLRRQRELDDLAATQALEVEQKVGTAIAAAREKDRHAQEAQRALERQQRELQDAAHEESKRQLQKKVDELQQRLQQGSMQVQGEAQEVELRKVLCAAFPSDRVEDVPKGVNGADLVQRVHATDGRDCGTIIWESKRTQHWSDGWLEKLRDDKRAAGASLAVIVSQALPAEVRGFGEREGVWICSWAHAVPLATILRVWLAEVTTAKLSAADSDAKGQRLYAYLTGQDFRNRFEGILEAYEEMRSDIDKEKKAFFSVWNKRERQLDRALTNLAAFHGDLRGISGASMEEFAAFALPTGATKALPPGQEDEGAEDEAPLALEGPLNPILPELVFSLVPDDGAAIGNVALRKKLESAAPSSLGRPVTDAEFQAARAVLLETGRLRKGRGRGGSVQRVRSDE